jgi:hypothetical protein
MFKSVIKYLYPAFYIGLSMTDDDEGSSEAIVVRSDYIEKHEYGDEKLEKAITEIVNHAIESDIRLEDTPENRQALRDYVRMEILLALKFQEAANKPASITTADERMIRSLFKLKLDGRDELYGDVKGEPGKERFMSDVREQVKKKVIQAKKKVDPLDKSS